MKTNQIMFVELAGSRLAIGYKDYFGSLSDLFQFGNSLRAKQGKKVLRIDKWRDLTSTKEFLEIVEKKIGENPLRSKRGKGGGVWAHLYALLDAAAFLSPELKLEIYDRFIESKIFEWRDRSGDNFIDLNGALALAGQEFLGKKAHKGHFINLAKIIRERLLGSDKNASDWSIASAKQLRERARIEEALTTMIRAGVVRDWNHLKELAKKV